MHEVDAKSSAYVSTYTHTHTHVYTQCTYESMFVTCVGDVLILRLSPLSLSLFHRCVPAPLGTVNFPKSTSRYSRRYSTSTQRTWPRVVRVTLHGNICDRPPRSIVDNGASARICVDHELLNGNRVVSLFMPKIAAFSRGKTPRYYTARSVNHGTTGGGMNFSRKENKRRLKQSCFNRLRCLRERRLSI